MYAGQLHCDFSKNVLKTTNEFYVYYAFDISQKIFYYFNLIPLWLLYEFYMPLNFKYKMRTLYNIYQSRILSLKKYVMNTNVCQKY